MSGAPSTLSMSSGTISGTPINANVGTHTIVVTATDGSRTAVSDTFDLNAGSYTNSTLPTKRIE